MVPTTHAVIHNHSWPTPHPTPHPTWVWITTTSTVDGHGRLGFPATEDEIHRFGNHTPTSTNLLLKLLKWGGMMASLVGRGREGGMKTEVMAATDSKRKVRLGLNARWACVLRCKVAATEAMVQTTMGVVYTTKRVGKVADLWKVGGIISRGLNSGALTKVLSLSFLQILNLLSCVRDSL
jgi:hypothetical protein